MFEIFLIAPSRRYRHVRKTRADAFSMAERWCHNMFVEKGFAVVQALNPERRIRIGLGYAPACHVEGTDGFMKRTPQEHRET